MKASVHSREGIKTLGEIEPGSVLVSICTVPSDMTAPFMRRKEWADITTLCFPDSNNGMNNVQANYLFSFIKKHKGKKFYVHCDAGLSRSVAVGCFLRDYYGYDLELLGSAKDDEFRNIAVYSQLVRQYYHEE